MPCLVLTIACVFSPSLTISGGHLCVPVSQRLHSCADVWIITRQLSSGHTEGLCVCVCVCVCVCGLFRATPAAYGSSQARGGTRAIAASLHHSYSNTGSELRL